MVSDTKHHIWCRVGSLRSLYVAKVCLDMEMKLYMDDVNRPYPPLQKCLWRTP
jgi:hypothetical protein